LLFATFLFTACGGGGSATTSPHAIAVVQKIPGTGQTTVYATGDNGTYSNINPMSFTDNGDGTITDNVTGLMWQKQDNGTKMTWANALTYCTSLSLGGHADWRLPSRMNLITIVNYGTLSPAINTTYFPSTQSSFYWPSTTYAGDTTYAWIVYFLVGTVYDLKTYTGYARCVRLGQ
jgi:hypothetical protein